VSWREERGRADVECSVAVLELHFKSGPRAGQRIRLRSETLIGREGVDLNLDDREVSRKHARIYPTDEGFVIEDVGSLNGTLLNSVPVRSATPLAHGDIIEMGRSEVEVSVEQPAAPAAQPRPPKKGRFGSYEVGEVIRQDGMFTTHKAYQESLDRYVALKILNDPGDAEFRARFRREAMILARLQHPNILPIYEQGEADGVPYLVVQYLDSETSLEDITGEPLELTRAIRLVVQVLGALDHAHRLGVVHRNIKPGNILLPLPTWPMLAGFEIAKLLDDPSRERLTREGMVIGTPAYMAPEQAFGMPVDGRSDLYAVGILLYELLTGQVPFVRDSVQAMLSAQAYESPPPARGLNPSLPPEAEGLLQTALMKESERRFQSADDMIKALEHLGTLVEGSSREDPVVKLYQEGVAAFQQGRWERAVERLERLLRIDPLHEDAESLLEAARREQKGAERRRF
jgi:tetratricopeptide (TPR) repeat protein